MRPVQPRHGPARLTGPTAKSQATTASTTTATTTTTPPPEDRFDAADDKKGATFRVRRTAFASSALFFGAEIAVKVNHVDPLNGGRNDLKLTWTNDGSNGIVDVESVLLRRQMGSHARFELQGPALQARADDEALPLKVRFIGLAVAAQVSAPSPHDDTPPQLEMKVEVKLTDKSLGSLAALAGATAELTSLTTELAGSAAGQAIGGALLTAIPVVSGAVALLSARRAVKTLRDAEATGAEKSLSVLRALADATSVVLPVVGTLANVALVAGTVLWARFGHHFRKTEGSTPPTGPPPTGPPVSS